MTRIVCGTRSRDGAVGLFISPPGVDADTAADNALLLNVTSKVSQLILIGRIAGGFPATVPLALGRSPLVFITSEFNFAGIIGHTLGPGPMRPSPVGLASSNQSTTQINGNGASMTISSGNNFPITFQVYSQAFT